VSKKMKYELYVTNEDF